MTGAWRSDGIGRGRVSCWLVCHCTLQNGVVETCLSASWEVIAPMRTVPALKHAKHRVWMVRVLHERMGPRGCRLVNKEQVC